MTDPETATTITIPALPSAADEEVARRFTVTYHYLRHLQIFLSRRYGRRDVSIGNHLAYRRATVPA